MTFSFDASAARQTESVPVVEIDPTPNPVLFTSNVRLSETFVFPVATLAESDRLACMHVGCSPVVPPVGIENVGFPVARERFAFDTLKEQTFAACP